LLPKNKDAEGIVLAVQYDDNGDLLRVVLNVQGVLAEMPAEETSLLREGYRPGETVRVRVLGEKEPEGPECPVRRLIVSERARELERLEGTAPKIGKPYQGKVVQLGDSFVRVKLQTGSEVFVKLPSLNYKGRERLLTIGNDVVVYVTHTDQAGRIFGTANPKEIKTESEVFKKKNG